ncbi:hypothetical protein ScPMuIL_015552 [Solemya velum]
MADDNIHKGLIDQFINITGVDSDRAKFYLESSAWNLELAMASFYEGNDDSAPVDITEETEEDWPSGSATKSRFATISNMREESSSSEEEGQAFYAGGSETSGQQIIGPKKNKNIVENLFKAAKAHGAEEASSADAGPKKKLSKSMFGGTGYRLGETDESTESDIIRSAPTRQDSRSVDVVLRLWKTGFTVDDGPLREYRDPSNQDFLSSIQRGEAPRELIKNARGGEVNINMEDHKDEEYVRPKVAMKAFSGAGHMLGSPAPNVVGSVNVSSEGGAKENVTVDSSQPTTNLQIRLADGSRLVAKFNHSHCIRDIRRYIIIARPQYESSNFILMTTFPNKELEDESQTLEQAKLLNAVIVQKLK